jgi:hypothetical protein
MQRPRARRAPRRNAPPDPRTGLAIVSYRPGLPPPPPLLLLPLSSGA